MSLALPGRALANGTSGAWGPVFSWPIIPIHSVLMPDGKVMTFGTDGTGNQGGQFNYSVWNPALGTGSGAHVLLPNYTTTDLFCAAQVLSPSTGKALMFGGDDADNAANRGNPNTNAFDTQTQVISDLGFAMATPRWYATATTLPNGDTLIQGGISSYQPTGVPILTPEIFNPVRGYRSLFGATSDFAYGTDLNRWWYPRAFVLGDGRVFNVSGPAMYFLDPAGDGSITPAGTFSGPNRGATSTAAMFQPGKILQVSGGMYANGHYAGAPMGAVAASVIDVTGATPSVTATGSLTYSRHWATSTILPNGSVLVTGGSPYNADLGAGYSPSPEVWNPSTGSWTVLAPETRARLYHSTALLLPDGRVLSAGGGSPGPVNNLDAQLFSPPYLYSGSNPAARPAITVSSAEMSYGGTVTINITSEPSPITRVTLVKTGAVTHSFNNEQRFLELSFSRSGNQLFATVPASSGTATPGYYLLFVLDSAGVPSVAPIMHLAPPSGPVNLVMDGGFETFTAPWGWWLDYFAGQSLGFWTVTFGGVSVHSNAHGNYYGGLGNGGASGLNHLDLNGPPIGGVTQTINGLIPGATYTLTYDYAAHDMAGVAGARVRIADLDHTWTSTNVGTFNWIQAAHRFTATSTSHALTFESTGGNPCCGMLIDDVAVVLAAPAAPSPVASFFPWNGGAGAVAFDGSTSFHAVAHSPALAMTNQLTLAARVYVDAFGDWDGIITKGVNTSPYAMQLWGNGIRFTANWGGPPGGVGGGSWNSSLPMTTGRWHHVAITYDGARIRFYVDGELDAYQPTAALTFGNEGEALVLGADFPGGDEYFDGNMADARVYNVALSADQVRALAATSAPAGATPVVSWAPWNGGAGAVSFNGVTDFVSIPYTAAMSTRKAVTLAARISVDVFGEYDGVITKGDATSPYALQLTATGQLRFTANWGIPGGSFGGGSWDSFTKVPPGQWHHVAVTYDGVNIRFYLDGQVTPYQPSANLTFGTNAEPLYFGADFPGGDEYFDGMMADGKMFDQALTAAQVKALAGP